MGKEHLVNYLLASEEMEYELERNQTHCWRVFDGSKWKFSLEDKQQAINLCKRLGGKCIGYAVWNEKDQANSYIVVELVS